MYAADLKHPAPDLEQKLYQLYNLRLDKNLDLGFRPPFLELLNAFGNPEQHLPPVIHVAGTNGKGSVVAMLKSILEEAGQKVHAYTSPHLLRFNERIVLAGQEITDQDLEVLIDEALALNKGKEVTFFEITTAMALKAFTLVPADYCLLEVGLGGRLDCTNVIESPLVTIINTIGFDHQEYLGETLEKIAFEKAGIMKRGVPCVIGPQHSKTVTDVLTQQAKERGVSLMQFGSDWKVEPYPDGFTFTFKDEPSKHPLPNLIGPHQIMNAGVALAALKAAEIDLEPDTLNSGLRKIQWRGRLQRIVKDVPAGWELWYDGGHNEDAARVLAAQAEIWQEQDAKPLHLIVGMKADKDAGAFLKRLQPFAKSITIVPVPKISACLNAEDVKDMDIEKAGSIEEAIRQVTSNHKNGRILACGSLYLAQQLLT